VTAEIRGVAQHYTVEALEGLAQIARTSESDAAKVAAWKAILDRGHGRPAQASLAVRGGRVSRFAGHEPERRPTFRKLGWRVRVGGPPIERKKSFSVVAVFSC